MVDTQLPGQIKNFNEAYSDQFKIVFHRELKETSFSCQVGNLPSISQPTFTVPNPLNVSVFNGTKLVYEPLQISFKVDADLNNFREIHDWLVGVTKPQAFQQFSTFQEDMNHFNKKGYVTSVDASLIQLNQYYNPNIEIVFVNIMPQSLGQLPFQLSTEGAPMVASASFVYDYYYFKDTGDPSGLASQ